MNQTEREDVDRERLKVVLGPVAPRYLTVVEAARAWGFSRQAVYRAIGRGELRASVVCSRIRIHPDDFLAWMDGDRTRHHPLLTSHPASGREGASVHARSQPRMGCAAC